MKNKHAITPTATPAASGEDTPFFYFLCLFAFVNAAGGVVRSLELSSPAFPYVSFEVNYLPLSWLSFLYILVACLGLYGLIKGPSRTRLLLLAGALLVLMWSLQPGLGNPALLCLFLVAAVVGSALYLYFAHGQTTRENMFALYAPAGRWLLIVMYFWGTFHKINTDFFDPDSSCATLLTRSLDYMIPFGLAEAVWVHTLAIYGTLLVEVLVLVMLLIPSQRYNARILGLCFHILIGFSYFRDYRSFSLLAIALHGLFVPAGSVQNSRALWRALWGVTVPWKIPWSVVGLGGMFLAMAVVFTNNALFWGVLCFFILLWTVLCTRNPAAVETFKKYFTPAVASFLLIPLAYFVLCAMPYVGLKTAQTLSMFSNLRTENGYSNHYLFPKPLYLFDYQTDVVTITRINNRHFPQGFLDPFTQRPLGTIYYDFVRSLKDNPDTYVEYQRNGGKTRVYKGDGNIPDLDMVLPYPASKFFAFSPVFLDTPPRPNACY